MKGIVLAGGRGSRLYPATLGITKHLFPIYDKPMIYYPISILMLAGIRDILIISTPDDIPNIRRLLGSGQDIGLNISFVEQFEPLGLAHAFILGKEFIGSDSVALVLGDNLFFGQGLTPILKRAQARDTGATLFAYRVADPRQFGVIELDEDGRPRSIEEKPTFPKSNWAITGLYFYDNSVVEMAHHIKASPRGELEISDINQIYCQQSRLHVEFLGRGFAWLDTGTYDNLIEASHFVQTIEHRQGYKIACLEEIAFNSGWINEQQLRDRIRTLQNSPYCVYLKDSVLPTEHLHHKQLPIQISEELYAAP